MKLAELAKHIDAAIESGADCAIDSVATLSEASERDVSFLSDKRYVADLANTKAAAVIVAEDFDAGEVTLPLLRVANVEHAVANVLRLFAPEPDLPAVGVHPSAVVASSAKLGANAAVGANVNIGEGVVVGDGTALRAGCVIGRDVVIGSNCVIHANVSIRQGCVLGDNIHIHDNTVIGADGFGYNLIDGKHCKITHIGIVKIENDVEIGANCCIDRAKFGQTLIGAGTKIDNLVQIAHNVQIGKNCILVAQAGIAGSSVLGNFVILAGQVGLGDHVNIGDGVQVGAQAGIHRDIAAGEKVVGSPALPVKTFFRQIKHISNLSEMARELKEIRSKIDTLEAKK
ncbi:MAG: UDP-3-O-(3-hydroxymyristoyl)glucosamine N-acyltransferase [Sedimentisphaerales bacterium]|nr:UDP-3-O-(3-hydroxymyristoyl)glucosamine N-acyltransferase [Sedimentisphaerales bacterium]